MTNIVRTNETLMKDELGYKTEGVWSILASACSIYPKRAQVNDRFYEPTTGRFISQDTYTGNPYDPWTQHLYSYCGNNPVNMVDPTGYKGEYILDIIHENSKKISTSARNIRAHTKIISDYSKKLGGSQSLIVRISTKLIVKEAQNIAELMKTNLALMKIYNSLNSPESILKKGGSSGSSLSSGGTDAAKMALNGLLDFYNEQGRKDDAEEMQKAKDNLYCEWGRMSVANTGKYIEIDTITQPNPFEQGMQNLLSLPIDPSTMGIDSVSAFFTGLDIFGRLIDGRNWAPREQLKTGDVVIYVSPDYNSAFQDVKDSESYILDYNVHGQWGIEYAFRGEDLIYYRNNWDHDVVWFD